MLKVEWVDGITNEEVLVRIREKITLKKNLEKRRDRAGRAHIETHKITEGYFRE